MKSSGNSKSSPCLVKPWHQWIFIGLIAFGSVMSVSGGFWLWERFDYARNGRSVDATVIRVEAGPSPGKGPRGVIPTFRFSDIHGKISEVKSAAIYAGGEVRAGGKVKLIYNASKPPGKLLLDKWGTIYGPPLFIFCFGTAFAALAIIGLRRSNAA